MTERLQARSIKTKEELIQSLIVLCKDKQVFTYMDDINKKKDTLYNPGSDLSDALNTFLDNFRKKVITEYNEIYNYDENKQLNKDKDLTSVIAAVNSMFKNDKNSLRDKVQKIYFAKYQAKKTRKAAEETRRKAKELIKKVDAAIKKRNNGYHGVLMRF